MAVYKPALFSEKPSPSYFLAFVTETKIDKARNIISMSVPYDLNIYI